MRFIDIKDNIIIADHCGDPTAVPVPAGAIREFYSFNFPGLIGEDIRTYSGEIKKDLQTLLREGLISIADNKEIIDNKIVDKQESTYPIETNNRIQEIKIELANIDSETIRPLRSRITGTSTPKDDDKLNELEFRANKLREELRNYL